MTDCAVWWAEPITATPTALALLDSAERQRYEAYRRPEDQRRFLTGRVLAKTVAASRLDRRPEEIRFDATCEDCGKQHGPVRVPGAALQLSISHAAQWRPIGPGGASIQAVASGAVCIKEWSPGDVMPLEPHPQRYSRDDPSARIS